MAEQYDDVQPLPSSLAREVVKEWAHDEDPRYGCWFCGQPSVALAPRNSGGDTDTPAHWLPVCQQCLSGWYTDVPDDEKLPFIPRFGVTLPVEQAVSVLARISYYVENNDAGVDEDELAAYDTLSTGLRALNRLGG